MTTGVDDDATTTDEAVTAESPDTLEAIGSDDHADDESSLEGGGDVGNTTGIAPAAAAVAAPVPEPFTVRTHGKTVTIDGALRIAGEGLRIPEGPALKRAQELMSRGAEFEATGQQRLRSLEAEVKAAREDQSDAEVSALAIMAWFDTVSASEDAMFEALSDWARNKPLIEARTERALVERDRRRIQREQESRQPSAEDRNAQIIEQAMSVAGERADELTQANGWTAADVAKAQARLMRRPQTYITQGPQGLAFDDDAFTQDLTEEMELRTASRTSANVAGAAATANARQQAGTVPAVARQAKPAVAAGQPRTTSGQFKSKEDWEREMFNG